MFISTCRCTIIETERATALTAREEEGRIVRTSGETMAPKDLPTLIRELRYARGWGPKELAKRAKIRRIALNQIARGSTTKPHTETLKRIARVFAVPVEVLLGDGHGLSDNSVAHRAQAIQQRTLTRSWPNGASSVERADKLIEKFRVLLSTPLGEGVAQIIEEAFRLLDVSSSCSHRARDLPGVGVEAIPDRRSSRPNAPLVDGHMKAKR
jgi:transcriptional regulator with XRE-family HTH domain